jgi:4-carboxymuconolactone decarboxylase
MQPGETILTIQQAILAGGEAVPAEARDAWLSYLNRTVIREGWERSRLPERDLSMIAIAALAALGCERQLRNQISAALSSGVERTTLCAVMLQVGGYAGIGRGFEGLCTLRDVFEESSVSGPGGNLHPGSEDEGQDVRVTRGLEILEVLRPGGDPLSVQYSFAPAWRRWLVRNAFGDLWSRRDLTLLERERVTLAVLVALGRESELRAHVAIAQNLGIPPSEIGEELTFLAIYVGFPAVVGALRMAVDAIDVKE